MASSIICKLSFADEMRRFTVKCDDMSYHSICCRINEILGLKETSYKLTYKDEEGDIITMTTDDEMAEAVALAISLTPPMLRLTVKMDAAEPTASKALPTPASENDLALAGLIKSFAEQTPALVDRMLPPLKALFSTPPNNAGGYGDPGVHPGVTCDRSGMCPIVGSRYNLKGHNYDLCEAEFSKLDPFEQAKFVKIDPPFGREVHQGVTCDKSGMCPIVGPRYNLKGHNYDLCEAEFNKLEPSDQAKFTKMEVQAPCRKVPCYTGGWYKDDNRLNQAHTVALQSKLQSEGFSCGPIDGNFGCRTKKALQMFLLSKGYELGPVDGCLGRRSTRALQMWARDQGANPGPIDGCWGGRTTRALLHALNGQVLAPEEPKGTAVGDELVKEALAAVFGMGGAGMPWKAKHGKCMGSGWRCGGRDGGEPQDKRHDGPKLAARFISDVSIFDGTQMAPGTKFTKIWRIKNAGESAWPAGTKMLFVGGDRMEADLAVSIGDSSKVVQPGEEVDIAVDMVAPTEAGRYLGYWRLVGPQGRRRFGQRVWCHIQVLDPSSAEQLHDPTVIEAEISHLMARTSANVEEEEDDELDACCAGPDSTPAAAECTTAAASSSSAASSTSSWDEVDEHVKASAEPKTDVAEVDLKTDALVEPKAGVPLEPKVVAPVEAAAVASVEPEAAAAKPVTAKPAAATAKPAVATAKPEATTARPVTAKPEAATSPSAEAPIAEEELPKNDVDVATELMKMGFDPTDVKLVVEKNMGTMSPVQLLEDCTRDLIKLSDWHEMLADLEEMGFGDHELNKRLMVKNDGSVKRTVKDLVADADLFM